MADPVPIGTKSAVPALATINGFRRIALTPERDHRGSLAMAHVAGGPEDTLRQLNVVRSNAGTLRGMHAHSRYAEYYVPIVGRMYFVIKDARRAASSFGRELGFWVGNGEPVRIEVPEGVAHAVYFAEPGVLAYGLSTPWTGRNEYGCRWNDPSIASPWPTQAPILSDRDAAAGTFEAMADALARDVET